MVNQNQKTAVKNILLTGCASGIGKHMAHVFAEQGHRLLLTDINYEALAIEAKAKKWNAPQIYLMQLDVRNPQEWKTAIEKLVKETGSIDLLINIAGYLKPGFIHEATAEQISLHLDINAKGAMLGSQAAAQQMIEQKAGHIINICSLAGIAPVQGITLYSASKFALRGFSLALAQELRDYQVYVTALCPDVVKTPMMDLQLDYQEAALTFSGPKPLTVEDIERVILKKVIPKKPLEVILPLSRGWLARLANMSPALAFKLGPFLKRKGLAQQKKFKSENENS